MPSVIASTGKTFTIKKKAAAAAVEKAFLFLEILLYILETVFRNFQLSCTR
jgi:hypothetical protein